MARKGKNENLKDQAYGTKSGPKQKSDRQTSCPHSTGILPYLLEPMTGPTPYKPTSTDELSELRREFKKRFGYKPVGMSVAQLRDVLDME